MLTGAPVKATMLHKVEDTSLKVLSELGPVDLCERASSLGKLTSVTPGVVSAQRPVAKLANRV